jgi:hypothetical protein
MSETSWTPGPWKIDPFPHNSNTPVICGQRIATHEIYADSSACWIAQVQKVQNVGQSGDANAALIAAAPDQDAALLIAELFVADELEVRRASMLPDPNEGESAYITDAEDVLNTIRAALAKARGEKPC